MRSADSAMRLRQKEYPEIPHQDGYTGLVGGSWVDHGRRWRAKCLLFELQGADGAVPLQPEHMLHLPQRRQAVFLQVPAHVPTMPAAGAGRAELGAGAG